MSQNDKKRKQALKKVDTIMNAGDPLGLMLAMMVGPDEAFEINGKDGQARMASMDVLPVQVFASEANQDAFWYLFERSGGRGYDVLEDDSLFREVELPPGWRKVPTEHYMHTNLVDDLGRKRAGIFYKPEFYDRRAHLVIEFRAKIVDLSYEIFVDESIYDVGRELTKDLPDTKMDFRWIALRSREAGGDRIIWLGEPYVEFYQRRQYTSGSAHDEADSKRAVAWFNEHHADIKDLKAGWDLDPIDSVELPDLRARFDEVAKAALVEYMSKLDSSEAPGGD